MIIWRGGECSRIFVAERFIVWLTPTLRAGLFGFPSSEGARRIPAVGYHDTGYGLKVFKIGPLTYGWT